MSDVKEIFNAFAVVDGVVSQMSSSMQALLLAILYDELVGEGKEFGCELEIKLMGKSIKAVRESANREMLRQVKEGGVDA